MDRPQLTMPTTHDPVVEGQVTPRVTLQMHESQLAHLDADRWSIFIMHYKLIEREQPITIICYAKRTVTQIYWQFHPQGVYPIAPERTALFDTQVRHWLDTNSRGKAQTHAH